MSVPRAMLLVEAPWCGRGAARGATALRRAGRRGLHGGPPLGSVFRRPGRRPLSVRRLSGAQAGSVLLSVLADPVSIPRHGNRSARRGGASCLSSLGSEARRQGRGTAPTTSRRPPFSLRGPAVPRPVLILFTSSTLLG